MRLLLSHLATLRCTSRFVCLCKRLAFANVLTRDLAKTVAFAILWLQEGTHMNFLYLQHSPGKTPPTVGDDQAQALRRKQDEQIAKWREERPAFLSKFFRRHPVLAS